MAEAAEQLVEPRSALVRFAQALTLTLFFTLAYAWTWALLLLMSRIVPEGSVSSGYEMFLEGLFAAAAFGPTVAALATSWLAYRNLKICRLWTGWRTLIPGLAFRLTAFFVAALVAPNYAILRTPLSVPGTGPRSCTGAPTKSTSRRSSAVRSTKNRAGAVSRCHFSRSAMAQCAPR